MAIDSGIKSLKTVVAIYEADVDPAEKNISARVEIQPYDPVVVDLRTALVTALSEQVNSSIRDFVECLKWQSNNVLGCCSCVLKRTTKAKAFVWVYAKKVKVRLLLFRCKVLSKRLLCLLCWHIRQFFV